MTYKEFHIWDFPEDKVRVLLDRHSDFLEDCINKFGSLKKLSDYLNVSYGEVRGWKVYNLYIPLWALNKIINKLKLDWYDIEKRIISYKGINTSNPLINPKLPIKESPELFVIMAHLIADGSVTKDGIPIYVNSNKALLNNFVKLLNQTFGDVLVHKRKLKNEVWDYRFPKIIIDIISSLYIISFNSYNARLPDRLFKLPNEFIYPVIRAIADDEGLIRENTIVIGMRNKELVLQVRDLIIKSLGTDSVGKLRNKGDYDYSFGIRYNYLNKYKRKIGFIHSEKKRDLLYAIKKQNIKKSGERKYLWETKFQILKLLSLENKNVKWLSQELFINSSNINIQLKQLAKKGLVRKLEKQKYSFNWKLTKRGSEFLNRWGFCKNKKQIKLPNWHKRFNLPQKDARILINDYGRKRLFWMLERTLGNQSKISNQFSVFRNTISLWKTGKVYIPLKKLDNILTFLNKRGINLINEVLDGVIEIKSINGIFKWYGR